MIEKFLETHLTFSEIIYIIIIERGNKNNKEEYKNEKGTSNKTW